MKIGIIAAMPEELELILNSLTQRYDDKLPAFTLHIGIIESHAVVLARAGIGKVNTAALTQMMINKGVTMIIMTGVAGAADASLKVGDIVISEDAIQHDVDVTSLGHEQGLIPGETLRWPANRELKELAVSVSQEIEGINTFTGTIATGDQFVADKERRKWIQETFNARCIEMEGAATAQVCHRWGVPFVIIRSVSDVADGDAEVDFRNFMKEAAKHAAYVVTGMLKKLKGITL